MKFKVEQYSSKYTIYYKQDGWFKRWHRINKAFWLNWKTYQYDKPENDFPVLFNDYESALKQANEWKEKPELLVRHNKEQDEKYKQQLVQWEKAIDKKKPPYSTVI